VPDTFTRRSILSSTPSPSILRKPRVSDSLLVRKSDGTRTLSPMAKDVVQWICVLVENLLRRLSHGHNPIRLYIFQRLSHTARPADFNFAN
jgi:hypothetical protein